MPTVIQCRAAVETAEVVEVEDVDRIDDELDALAAEAPDDARRAGLLQSLRDWGHHLQEQL